MISDTSLKLSRSASQISMAFSCSQSRKSLLRKICRVAICHGSGNVMVVASISSGMLLCINVDVIKDDDMQY